MLAAGMKGVEKKYMLAEPVEEDIFEMDEKAREKAGIFSLPGSLYQAIALCEKSKLIKRLWASISSRSSLKTRDLEWDLFRTHVSQFEIDRYLPML